MPLSGAYVEAVHCSLGAVLDHELDLWWLPPLVAFVFIWQFIYDRWAKRGPRRRLWVASIGYGQRAAAGSLAAMSAAHESTRCW